MSALCGFNRECFPLLTEFCKWGSTLQTLYFPYMPKWIKGLIFLYISMNFTSCITNYVFFAVVLIINLVRSPPNIKQCGQKSSWSPSAER